MESKELSHIAIKRAVFCVRGIRTRVFFVLVALRLGQELVEGDEPVAVDVRLPEDVLPHPLHLLFPLTHVVLGSVGIVNLVQLFLEKNLEKKE